MNLITKALTLHRPWGWAIVYLPADERKPVENRPWMPPKALIGQRIAIHAGLKHDDEQARVIARRLGVTGLPPKSKAIGIIGTARIPGIVISDDSGRRVLHAGEWGEVSPLQTGPWFFGPYGWLLDQIIPFEEPIECKGFQRLWNIKPDHLEQVNALGGAHCYR